MRIDFAKGAAGRSLALAAAAGLVATPSTAFAQPRPVGINAAVRNQVQIRNAGTRQVHPAVLKARVMLNDEVRTGQASQLQIMLLDRSTFTVGGNARATIDRFVFDPATNSRSAGLSVARGAFRFMSGRTLGHPSGPANLRTRVASIGIRGTIFEGAVGMEAVALANRQAEIVAMHLNYDPQKATFVVLRGPGQNTQGDTRPGAIDVQAAGRTVTLNQPGMAVFIPRAGAAPIGPFQVSRSNLNALQLMLRTTPAMAPAVIASVDQAGAGGGGPGGPSSNDGGPRGQSEGASGHGFSGIVLAVIPAIILAILATQSGKNGDRPISP